MLKKRRVKDGVAIRHDARCQNRWHIGCIVDCEFRQESNVRQLVLLKRHRCRLSTYITVLNGGRTSLFLTNLKSCLHMSNHGKSTLFLMTWLKSKCTTDEAERMLTASYSFTETESSSYANTTPTVNFKHGHPCASLTGCSVSALYGTSPVIGSVFLMTTRRLRYV